MLKVSSFLIGIVIVGTIISLFGLSLSQVATTTGQTYNNDTFSGLNKVNEVQTSTNALKSNITKLQTSTSLKDKLEALFGGGYSAFAASIGSFDVAMNVSVAGINKLNLGDSSSYLSAMIITLIIITLVFILLSVLLKREV